MFRRKKSGKTEKKAIIKIISQFLHRIKAIVTKLAGFHKTCFTSLSDNVSAILVIIKSIVLL